MKNINYNVINAGVSGSDIIYSYKLLDTLTNVLKPKIILYNLNYSDIDDIIYRGGKERYSKGFRKAYWWEFIYSYSYLFRAILHKFNINPYMKDGDDLNYAWNTIYSSLKEYDRFCKDRNIKFICILTPGPSEIMNLDTEYTSKKTWNGNLKFILEKNKKDNQIEYIDTQNKIYERIQAENNLYKYYYELDFHLKPMGYWYWGQIISDEITSLYNFK